MNKFRLFVANSTKKEALFRKWLSSQRKVIFQRIKELTVLLKFLQLSKPYVPVISRWLHVLVLIILN